MHTHAIINNNLPPLAMMQTRPKIRWDYLIDEIFGAGYGYDRILAECGMERYIIDEIIDRRAPKKHERLQLFFIAGKAVSIGRLESLGFTGSDMEKMCSIVHITAKKVRYCEDLQKAFS